MNESLSCEKEKEDEKEIIISDNGQNLTNDIFDKLCNIQKLIKKESSLIKLCKRNKIHNNLN